MARLFQLAIACSVDLGLSPGEHIVRRHRPNGRFFLACLHHEGHDLVGELVRLLGTIGSTIKYVAVTDNQAGEGARSALMRMF